MQNMQPVIGPHDPECELLLAVIKIALRDLRCGAGRPHYASAVTFLQALGVLNDHDELDRAAGGAGVTQA